MEGWRSSPEEKMILWDISWETYERLLVDHTDKSVPRFAYALKRPAWLRKVREWAREHAG